MSKLQINDNQGPASTVLCRSLVTFDPENLETCASDDTGSQRLGLKIVNCRKT